MTRRRRILLSLGIVAAILAAAGGGVRAWFPGWLRGTIERVATDKLGREVRIDGAFDLSLSLTPSVTAGDVRLANLPGGSDSSMVRLGRVEVSVDLTSLWSRPVRVRELRIEGVRILLETVSDGNANWRFAIKPSQAPAEALPRRGGPPVVFDHASLRDLEFVYRSRRDVAPLRMGISSLEARLEPPAGMIDLDASGNLNDAPWDVAGKLGTLDRLFAFQDVEQAVTGHLGASRLAVQGRIHDPLALGEPNVEWEVEGPDVAAALATFGVRSPVAGPYHLRGRVSSAKGDVDFDLDAGLAGVGAKARGRVSALLRPDTIDAIVSVSGPDTSIIGGWTGIRGLPPGPFEVAGRVRRDHETTALDDVEVRAGKTSATASGTLGDPPRFAGTVLTIAARGKDLSELSGLVRWPLPRGPFAARGKLLRREDALAVEATEIRLREAVIHVAGAMGEPPRLQNLDLTADAAGPDLSALSAIATVALPPQPFAVRGRVARRGPAFELDGVAGRVGENQFEARGRLVPAPRLAGTAAHVRLAGPDLASAASLAGLHGLPALPYEVSGQIAFGADGWDLEDIEAQAGRISASARGHVGARPLEAGTAIDGRVSGRSLSDLAAWGAPKGLPDDPFAASGHVGITGGLYHVEGFGAEIGEDRAAVEGMLGALPDIAALDAEVSAQGPSLAAVARFAAAAGIEAPKGLPAKPYEVRGRVRKLPAGIGLADVRASVGDVAVGVDGTIGATKGLRGTDLRVEASAPDASLVTDLSGVSLPAGPLEARGHVERLDSGTRLDGIEIALGDTHAGISGTVGEPPEYSGTDVDVSVMGTDLAAFLGPITGLSPLPETGFEIGAHVTGDARGFVSDRFMARLGASDLEGGVKVSRSGKPVVEADLHSTHLGVREMIQGFSGETSEAPAGPAPKRKSREKGELLLPVSPLSLAALHKVDARIRLTANEVGLPSLFLRDVTIEGGVEDGALRLDRFEGTGRAGGRFNSSLSLEPVAEGYRLTAKGDLTGGRIDLTKAGEAPENAPSLEIEFEVNGTGPSLHDIAASSGGGALITIGPGRIPATVSDLVTSGVVKGLLEALNPFRKNSPYTQVECGIVAAGIDGGKMAVEPIAGRTDKLTITGRGKIDFDSEAIDLVWTLKPRKGVGISAASISNPYIKLGGTLSVPSLEAKPFEAVASTGAAVATAGLTVLFRGIYDRITAEKNVCTKALEQVKKQAAARGTGPTR